MPVKSWPDDLADLLPTADGGVMMRKREEEPKPSYKCVAEELETCRKALGDVLFAIGAGFSGETWAGVRDGARTAHDRAQNIALAALSQPQGELPKPVPVKHQGL